MKKYTAEVSVGVFMVIGLLCLGYLTVKLGKMELFSEQGYQITARFASVTGLKTGASVEIAGVPVGKVTGIGLEAGTGRAVVTLQIDKAVALTDDCIASVKTSGLIGDKFISLSLGSGEVVPPHGELTETESSVDIEALISKYVFGGTK